MHDFLRVVAPNPRLPREDFGNGHDEAFKILDFSFDNRGVWGKHKGAKPCRSRSQGSGCRRSQVTRDDNAG